MPWYEYITGDGVKHTIRASYDGKDVRRKAEKAFGPDGDLKRSPEPKRFGGREVVVYDVDDLHVK